MRINDHAFRGVTDALFNPLPLTFRGSKHCPGIMSTDMDQGEIFKAIYTFTHEVEVAEGRRKSSVNSTNLYYLRQNPYD